MATRIEDGSPSSQSQHPEGSLERIIQDAVENGANEHFVERSTLPSSRKGFSSTGSDELSFTKGSISSPTSEDQAWNPTDTRDKTTQALSLADRMWRKGRTLVLVALSLVGGYSSARIAQLLPLGQTETPKTASAAGQSDGSSLTTIPFGNIIESQGGSSVQTKQAEYTTIANIVFGKDIPAPDSQLINNPNLASIAISDKTPEQKFHDLVVEARKDIPSHHLTPSDLIALYLMVPEISLDSQAQDASPDNANTDALLAEVDGYFRDLNYQKTMVHATNQKLLSEADQINITWSNDTRLAGYVTGPIVTSQGRDSITNDTIQQTSFVIITSLLNRAAANK